MHNEDNKQTLGQFGDIIISVYANEPYTTPHFHFENAVTNEKGAIKLHKPMYFNHEEYNATLSKDELAAMQKYLSNSRVAPMFLFVCDMWQLLNKRLRKFPKLPNYVNIK